MNCINVIKRIFEGKFGSLQGSRSSVPKFVRYWIGDHFHKLD